MVMYLLKVSSNAGRREIGGYPWIFYKPHARAILRASALSFRSVNPRHALPENVVAADSTTLFKVKLDESWFALDLTSSRVNTVA